MANSSIPKFYEKSKKERIKAVASFCGLSKKDVKVIQKNGGISFDEAD